MSEVASSNPSLLKLTTAPEGSTESNAAAVCACSVMKAKTIAPTAPTIRTFDPVIFDLSIQGSAIRPSGLLVGLHVGWLSNRRTVAVEALSRFQACQTMAPYRGVVRGPRVGSTPFEVNLPLLAVDRGMRV